MRFSLPFLALTAFAPLVSVSAQTKSRPQSVPAPKTAPSKTASKAKKPTKSPTEKRIDALWLQADAAFHKGDYARTIALNKQIVALDATETEAYSNGAWLMWSLGNGQQALDFLARGLKANPKNPEMWDVSAQHYDLQKRYSDSARAYAKAIEFSRPKPDQMLRRRYAHATERVGNLSKSAEIWRALVADFPNEAVNKNNLARVTKKMAIPAPGSAIA
ncbi:MAG TPA: tetratricopeptide repeat protein [Abditibacterium sp.]|jgi:tetratricopeptide (TPR) repeat protein